MTPAEEDALVAKTAESIDQIYAHYAYHQATVTDTIRLAIRAAYAQGVAQERERAAKVCDEMNGSPWHTPTARKLAAAIRKEEKP